MRKKVGKNRKNHLNLICTYSDQTKEEFYSTLLKVIKSVKASHPNFKFIVGGDFNATIGRDCESEKWDCVERNNDSDPTSSNGIRKL